MNLCNATLLNVDNYAKEHSQAAVRKAGKTMSDGSWIIGLNAQDEFTGTKGIVIATHESGYDIKFDDGSIGTYSWETNSIAIG